MILVLLIRNNNKNFVSDYGVLYSSNFKELLAYPKYHGSSYTVHQNCKIIGFASCSAALLSTITLNDVLETISGYSLQQTQIKSIWIPDSVREINEYAFVVGNIINTEGNDYAISDGHGVLRIDNTQGIIDDMCIGDSAIVEGIIQLAEYNDDVKDYVFYALGIDKIDYTNTINDIDNNIKLWGGRGVITIAGNVL